MYSIKRITNSLYKDIQELFSLSFGSEYSLKEISTKYNTSIFGLENIGFLAKGEKGDVAAYYGVFPIILRYKDADYLVAQSGDTMTAPNHRKKGLFTKLALKTYDLSKEEGVKFIFGFPNQNSLPGFKYKLNWVFNGFMQRFNIEVNTLPFCELASRYSIFQSLYNNYVKKKLSKLVVGIEDVDFEKFNDNNVDGSIKKDKNFFKYKLLSPYVYLININGFDLLIKVKTHLYVGEVGVIKGESVLSLLKELKKLSKQLGAKRVVFTMSRNHWLFDILKKEYEPIDSLPIGFYIIDDKIDYKQIQFTNADYDTF